MPKPYTGKHSFREVDRVKPNGSIYVYDQESWYDPAIKNTRYKHKLKGIRDPKTGAILPTRHRTPNHKKEDMPETTD